VIVLSTVAIVINTYFQILAAQDRLRIARDNVNAATRILKVFQDRIGVGTATGLDIAQQESLVAQQRASIPPLEQLLRQNIATLGLLLGEPPARLTVRGGSLSAIVPQRVSPGLPSDLLLQRPDIRQAEEQLHAANARIGVARAALFPSITLTGYYGGESQALGDLFTGPARTWNIGAGLLQPLFAAGQIRGGVELAEARTQEAAELYQKAVATAFKEVRDSIAEQTNAREALIAQRARERSLARTAELTRLRYDNGAVSLFEVLDIERLLIAARLEAIDAERARSAAIVNLYLALGF